MAHACRQIATRHIPIGIDPRYDQNGHARCFIEPSRDDEDISDVSSFLDTAPIDTILRATKNPAGYRRR